MAIADINADFANHTKNRYGFERAEGSWQAIVDADDIDAVSIVVANHLHREIAEALLASGKHVLCEKPLASRVQDAEAMAKAAAESGRVAACGFSYRRSPAASAIGEQIKNGSLGEILHFNGRYWCDYSADPDAPTSWRYQGPLGSGALADIGSHILDLSEHLCGRIARINGATLPIVIKDRPVPLGATLGHAAGGAVSDERKPVTNEDIATFVVEFANGAAGTFSISRVALGHPNELGFEVFGTEGAARFDLSRNAEFGYIDNTPEAATNGWRRVIVGPAHPYVAAAQSMPFPENARGHEVLANQARVLLTRLPVSIGCLGRPPLPTGCAICRSRRPLSRVRHLAPRSRWSDGTAQDWHSWCRRIADDGIVDPSRALGHRLVAVAARDRTRAERFARQRDIEKVHETYADVIDDPDVDVVYNALVNSLHATWNQYALQAGKHVLSEKPFASNASEAALVRDVANTTSSTIVEGFHYLHHPVNQRLRDLVMSGDLGEINYVEIELRIPGPPDDDPRWSLELAGGATMDLGCYVLNAARQVGRWLDEAPSVISAEAILKEPNIDAAMRVELAYPSGIQAQLHWDMNAQDRAMVWTIKGTAGTATVPAFAVPHMDNRIVITKDGDTEEQTLGDQTSYTYQLAALTSTLQTGAEFLIDVDDSVAKAELIDDVTGGRACCAQICGAPYSQRRGS